MASGTIVYLNKILGTISKSNSSLLFQLKSSSLKRPLYVLFHLKDEPLWVELTSRFSRDCPPPLKWKRLNPYLIAIIGSTMVEIQCPHCEEDVELEDGGSGLFDCPHCNNEFEFIDTQTTISYRPKIVVIVLLIISILFALISGGLYLDSISESEECDDCDLEESFVTSAGDAYGNSIEAMFSYFCLMLSGVFLFIAIVTYAIQQTKRSR